LETTQTPVSPKWNERDVTKELIPYAKTTHVFHRISIGRISTAIYLFVPAFGNLFLEHKPEFHLNTLEVYNIRVGIDGLHVGYLFRSPLRIKCDPYFVHFIRRNIDPIQDIIKHPVSVERRYTLQELVFHVHDTGYLITRVEDNGITKMLNN
jgi:hypothetical protein